MSKSAKAEAVERCRLKELAELDRVKNFEKDFSEEEKVLEICKKMYADIEEKNDRLMNYVISHECRESSKRRTALFIAMRESTSFVIPDQPVYCPPKRNVRGRKPGKNPTDNAKAVRRTREKTIKALETGLKFEQLCLWQGPILKALQDRLAKSEEQNRALMNYIRTHECTLSTQSRYEFCQFLCPSVVLQAEVPRDPRQSQSNNTHHSSDTEHQSLPDMDLEDDRPSAFVPVSHQPDSSTQFVQCSQPLVIPEYSSLSNFYITKCFWKYFGTGVPVLPADFVKQAGLPDYSSPNWHVPISDRSLNSALGIKDEIKCTECGWDFPKRIIRDQIGTRSTDQQLKCKNCAEFWRVPRWGGEFMMDGVTWKIENTCSLDSFLAILAGHHKKNPTLINAIGTSLYETCLKNLLTAPDIDRAKIELVVQCYMSRINICQRKFDLFGADSANLEELTKSASPISYSSYCKKCGDEKDDTKFEYVGRDQKPRKLSWIDFIHGIIFSTQKCKKHLGAGVGRCEGETAICHLEMNGWMIPIDLSLLKHKLQARTVEEFPNELHIGHDKFELGGISIHRSGPKTSADHFLSLVPHRSKWVLYDGMQEGTPNKYIPPN